MKNNNLIPSLLIACGLFYVGANLNKEQETKVIQAEPVVAKTVASSTGVGEPVIVWYGSENERIYRAWSDGTVEVKVVDRNFTYENDGVGDCVRRIPNSQTTFCGFWFTTDWEVISSPQMACRTDINGNGEIEFGDLLAVLNQWGDQATCPDTVQLQCGLMQMN